MLDKVHEFIRVYDGTTINDKNYGKNWYLGNFVFLPLPPLNNVEKEWANLRSSYVMCSQHSIGPEREFLNTLFKISIIFCHDCLKFTKRERWSSGHAVSDNSNLLEWVLLCHATFFHEHKMTRNGIKMAHKRSQ